MNKLNKGWLGNNQNFPDLEMQGSGIQREHGIALFLIAFIYLPVCVHISWHTRGDQRTI